MMHALQQVGFIGGIITALLGLILILIVNDTGHVPEVLVNTMLGIVFVSGTSVFLSIVKRSL
ncbi:hypothetical protein [Marinoscillum sp. MHG1-6]|uniref:hypothetical protein n=1 Tax=Marinoscillum sp. MHG1-6 TaxID=2959627 RepID=UPI0021588126|nr:hypothetical protein [Marinoscillum sp. MHG1-6]